MSEIMLLELEFLVNLFMLIYGMIIFTDVKLTSKLYKYIIFIIFDVLVSVWVYAFIPKYSTPLSILLIYLTIIFIFDGKLAEKSKYSALIYLIMGMAELILSLLGQFIGTVYNIKIQAHYICYVNYFIMFMFFVIYGKIKRRKNLNGTVNGNYIGAVCGIIIICNVCFDFIIQRNKEMFAERLTSTYIVCSLIACIILIVIFAFFVHAEKERIYYKYESEMRDKLLEANAEHYKLTLDNFREFRRQRHDFRGHIIAMKEMVKNKNLDLLESHMDELFENYVNSDSIIRVNDEAADSVINYFAGRAKQEGIDFKCEGGFRTKIPMTSFQICTCFYNLLNNAVEACKKIEDGEKSILVRIRSYRGTLMLTFENTVAHPVDKVHWETGISSKKDAESHGFGLMNVKAVVAELDGQILFENVEGRFRINIILPPPDDELMQVPQ